MVMRHPGLLAILGFVAGCHSTSVVDPHPGPWVIDDFEDGDGESEAHGFAAPVLEHWECRPKDGSHAIAKCEVTTDPDPPKDRPQNKVLHLESTLWPVGHGVEFTRSEVATFIDPPQDLTAYESFRVSAKLIGNEAQPKLKFQLSCVQVRGPDGGISTNPCILMPLEGIPPLTWKTYDMTLAGFLPPQALAEGQKVAAKECLAHVDGIKITVDSESNVPAGQTWTFDLYVDDIQFIP